MIAYLVRRRIISNESPPSDRLLASTGMKANRRPTMQSCNMRVPMVIWPCCELVAFASVKHFTTIEVEDIDTCGKPKSELAHEEFMRTGKLDEVTALKQF